MFEETFVLNNGVKIPKLALGTRLMDDRTAKRCSSSTRGKIRRRRTRITPPR